MGRFVYNYKEHRPNKNHLVYTYDRVLDTLIDEENVSSILEIGFVANSVRWWKACYPHASIVVWDIVDRKLDPTEFTYLKAQIVGPQTGDSQIGIAKENGPYDIICDDASHKPLDQIQTFEAMWDSIKEDGIYIIEDVQIEDQGGMDVWPKIMKFCASNGKGHYLDSLLYNSRLIIVKKEK